MNQIRAQHSVRVEALRFVQHQAVARSAQHLLALLLLDFGGNEARQPKLAEFPGIQQGGVDGEAARKLARDAQHYRVLLAVHEQVAGLVTIADAHYLRGDVRVSRGRGAQGDRTRRGVEPELVQLAGLERDSLALGLEQLHDALIARFEFDLGLAAGVEYEAAALAQQRKFALAARDVQLLDFVRTHRKSTSIHEIAGLERERGFQLARRASALAVRRTPNHDQL